MLSTSLTFGVFIQCGHLCECVGMRMIQRLFTRVTLKRLLSSVCFYIWSLRLRVASETFPESPYM